jgi:acyl-CoA dehydrogenase
MTIDLRPDDHVAELAARTAAFVRDIVVPEEERLSGVVAAGGEELRTRLQQAARDAGVFAPHVAAEYGGHGLDMRGRAVVFEEAGWSLFGPLALNIAAPDEGNMHLLEAVATAEQKERYLRPLAEGRVRSCFAMTEPAPGAGSDPAALSTTATPTRGGWVVNGRKWFITGADGAAFTICMARTSGRPGDRGGATMFLIDAGTPGLRIVRHIDTLDEGFFGGHCELELEDVFVSEESVLGAVDKGFENAQVRLAPARLTHCMRWLGIARRAQEIAVNRAAGRRLFGSRLGDLGMVQAMVADSEIDIAASRLLIWQACAELDQGRSASQSSSIAKTFVAEAVGRVVDRSLQICGALGISGDVLLSRFHREVRPFRIYDGPSETHRWAIAKRRLSQSTVAPDTRSSSAVAQSAVGVAG